MLGPHDEDPSPSYCNWFLGTCRPISLPPWTYHTRHPLLEFGAPLTTFTALLRSAARNKPAILLLEPNNFHVSSLERVDSVMWTSLQKQNNMGKFLPDKARVTLSTPRTSRSVVNNSETNSCIFSVVAAWKMSGGAPRIELSCVAQCPVNGGPEEFLPHSCGCHLRCHFSSHKMFAKTLHILHSLSRGTGYQHHFDLLVAGPPVQSSTTAICPPENIFSFFHESFLSPLHFSS